MCGFGEHSLGVADNATYCGPAKMKGSPTFSEYSRYCGQGQGCRLFRFLTQCQNLFVWIEWILFLTQTQLNGWFLDLSQILLRRLKENEMRKILHENRVLAIILKQCPKLNLFPFWQLTFLFYFFIHILFFPQESRKEDQRNKW